MHGHVNLVCYVYLHCSAAADVGPELQVMIKEQQDKLRKEYETKLAGLVRIAYTYVHHFQARIQE